MALGSSSKTDEPRATETLGNPNLVFTTVVPIPMAKALSNSPPFVAIFLAFPRPTIDRADGMFQITKKLGDKI